MPASESVTTLQVRVREAQGKGPARRLRASGQVPGVVYRRAQQPLAISLDPKALRAAVAGEHRFNTLLTLEIEGGTAAGTRLVLLKDHQVDPLEGQKLLHVDFLEVRTDEKIRVELPVVLTGKPIGVLDGGILQQTRRFLQVLALPTHIPLKIEVDVSQLKISQSIHVADLKMPEGAELKYQTNFTIAVVSAPEKEEVVVPVVAAVVEGAAAAAPGAPAVPGAKEGEKAPAGAKEAAAPAGKGGKAEGGGAKK
jgi:large subunit ribosomal protein L25